MTWWQSAAHRTAAAQMTTFPVFFLELGLSSGTLRWHDGMGDVVWGGNTWQGIGMFGELTPLTDDIEKPWGELKGRLSGVDATLLASILTENYFARSAKVYVGMLDQVTHQLVADPELKMDYRFESVDVELGDFQSPVASLPVTFGPNVETDAAPPRYTDEEQQRLFASDRGLKWLHLVAKVVTTWGVANTIHWSGRLGGGPIQRIPTKTP